MTYLNLKNVSDVVRVLIAGAASVVVGYALNILLFKIYSYITKFIPDADLFPKHLKSFLRILIILFLFSVAVPFLHLTGTLTSRIMSMAILIAYASVFAFGLIKLTYVLEEIIIRRNNIKDKGDFNARKIYTQVKYVKKILIVAILIIAFSFILIQFKSVRSIGTTLLASAGIAGIIIGFAAQKSLNLFIAGLRVAITQPIKIDDVLVINGEWGRVEEISLTYVVLKIWDLRRLVIPVNFFIENSFQNWTRTSADLLGTVFIYTDYSIDVDVVRQEVFNIVQSTDLWDKQAWGLQVTNASEKTMELRALVSASDSSKLWDLRCLLREKLIGFIGNKYPQSLPKMRNQVMKEEDKA